MRAAKDIKTIVIAGGGTIGTAIAQVFSLSGYKVFVYDNNKANLEKCQKNVENYFHKRVEQGKDSAADCDAYIDRVSCTLDINVFKKADYVVENILEDLETKREFWNKISRMVDEDVVLATNTSGLSVSSIAEQVYLPERFAGMHWTNPPHIMPLVEVVSGEKTAQEASDIIYDVSIVSRRRPVRVKDTPGFVFNRLQFALLREAMNIVEMGVATPEDVDNVLKGGLGMRYATAGPFETGDMSGVDIFYQISSYLFPELSDRKDVPKQLADAYANGNYGIKTGKGFYDYPGNTGAERMERRDQMMEKLSAILFPDL